MLSMQCRPEKNGFWFKVSAPDVTPFDASFVAIGPGGHQTFGRLRGQSSPEWDFQRLNFPVMHAAITQLQVGEHRADGHSPVPGGQGRQLRAAAALLDAVQPDGDGPYRAGPYLAAAPDVSEGRYRAGGSIALDIAPGPYLTGGPYLAASPELGPYGALDGEGRADELAEGPYLAGGADEDPYRF